MKISEKEVKSQESDQLEVTLIAFDPREVEMFLNLVVQGWQDKAEQMLQQNPTLVLARGTVNDLSGRDFNGADPTIARLGQREFQEITGFQYAVWALDWHMWTMLRKYLSNEQAAMQLNEIESTPWARKYRVHAGLPEGPLQVLINALQTYINNYSHWDNSERAKHWQKQVGGAQLLLPSHVINEYCRQDRAFYPCPTFTEKTLPRTREINVGEWCTAIYNKGKLGEKFGVYRASGHRAGRDPAALRLSSLSRGRRPGGERDLIAVSNLIKVRIQQRECLLVDLQAPLVFNDSHIVHLPKPMGLELNDESVVVSSQKQNDEIPVMSVLSSQALLGSNGGQGLSISLESDPLSCFLGLIVRGEQSQAEAMLKEDPGLVLLSGNVQDLSGRYFEGITGFQYALWALDYRMWEMLKPYLGDALLEQVRSLGTGPWVQSHGIDARVHVQNLIQAIKTYIKNYPNWSPEEASVYWKTEVGGAQRLLPVHVMNEYCNPEQSFATVPNFLDGGSTVRSLYAKKTRHAGQNIYEVTVNGEGLGVGFGVYRSGGKKGAIICDDCAHKKNKMVLALQRKKAIINMILRPDEKAMSALLKARMQQRAELMADLQAPLVLNDSHIVHLPKPMGLELNDESVVVSSQKQNDEIPVMSVLSSQALLGSNGEQGLSISLESDPLSCFLGLIVRGEQSQAEAMLKEDPGLALLSGNVQDLSGRYFEGITGFQYAFWALDYRMWEMLKPYLGDVLLEQARSLETGPWVQSHGIDARVHLQNLIQAIKTYIKQYLYWDYERRCLYWKRNVGGAQRLLPAHVMNEYCNPKQSFKTVPNFLDKSAIVRSLQAKSKRRLDITCLNVYKDTLNGEGMGVGFGVYRSERGQGPIVSDFCGVKKAKSEDKRGIIHTFLGPDEKAMRALLKTRLQQRAELMAELQLLDDKGTAALPKHNGGVQQSDTGSAEFYGLNKKNNPGYLETETLDQQSLLAALEHAKESFKEIARSNNILFFEPKSNVFLLSLHATEQQPYGPYADRMCTPDDPVAVQAQQCYTLSKEIKTIG